jgi:hypothetical protein
VAETFDSGHDPREGSPSRDGLAGGRVHILLVEDDERISAYVAKALRGKAISSTWNPTARRG